MQELLNPDTLTTGIAIVLTGINIGLLFSNVYFKSIIGMASWVLLMLGFIAHIIFNIELLIYWIGVMVNVITLPISIIAYTSYRVRI